MRMKRVRELIERWERITRENDDILWDAEDVVKDLKAAIAPDWKPASEPPEHEMLVWVIDGGEPRKANYDHGLKMFEDMYGDYMVDATHWHEIEVPEPPEVGT